MMVSFRVVISDCLVMRSVWYVFSRDSNSRNMVSLLLAK